MCLNIGNVPSSPDQAVSQFLHVCRVRGAFPGQDASVDSRVQGLHSASQHLRMSGQLRHIPDTQQTQVFFFKKRNALSTGFECNQGVQLNSQPDSQSGIAQGFGCAS